MRIINQIIIHCSDSPFGCWDLIHKWHVDERGWDDVGYHYIINNGKPLSADEFSPDWDGHLETGRRIEVQGAHCRGQNGDSIGICLIGNGLYTPRQLNVLKPLVSSLQIAYEIPDFMVVGHRDYDKGKTCPGFDVSKWIEKP